MNRPRQYTFNIPFADFYISTSKETQACFSCSGGSGGYEIHIGAEYAGAYGIGERYDALNYLGRSAEIAVEEKFCRQGDRSYCPMPFFWTDAGFGVWLDTARVTRFGFTPGEIMINVPKNCEIHVFAGTPQEIVAEYMRHTGAPELPPDWVFEPWISANHWDSRAKLEAALDEAKRRGFPVGTAVAEAWSDEATFYSFRSEELWPDPAGMIARLHERGIHLVLWQIPVYKQLVPHEPPNEQLERDWEEAIERGLCVMNADGTPYRIPEGHWFAGSLVPDFTNPQTVESWFGKRRYLTQLGVDGFKTDGGEFILSGEARFHNGMTGAEGRNLYPLLYTKAYTDFLEPGQILFSRAGYTGAQTTPMLWAGDQLSTFEELRSQLNAGLSASASGIIFWGFDIGGFAGELPTPELYMRSTQLACFSPVMQWHSEPDGGQFQLLQPGIEGNNERSPWNIEKAFGLTGYAEKVRDWHLLRMELLPYIREQARICVERRMPLMRPMTYAFPTDVRCAGIDDEYMFGDSLLVAPVTAPGVTSREVYLPAGEWFDFYTGERFEGGQTVKIECAERIPVFSPGGRWRENEA